jgi:hypothetical protein
VNITITLIIFKIVFSKRKMVFFEDNRLNISVSNLSVLSQNIEWRILFIFILLYKINKSITFENPSLLPPSHQ